VRNAPAGPGAASPAEAPPYGSGVPAVPELDVVRIRRYCEDRFSTTTRDVIDWGHTVVLGDR
jgi:hypothetical protein